MVSDGASPKAVQLHPDDNLAVAIQDLEPGEIFRVGGVAISARDRVPAGHKVALRDVSEAHDLVKYGESIGVALESIKAGSHVHTHNLGLGGRAHRQHGGRTRSGPNLGRSLAPKSAGLPSGVPTFQGYLRGNGKVGTRNYLLVIATANCSAGATRQIAAYFGPQVLNDYPNVDGVAALTHKSGCGMRPGGDDYRQLQRTLAGYAQNPNVFASVFVGLGCETNQVDLLLKNHGLDGASAPPEGPPRTLVIQSLGGFQRTVEAGVEAIKQLLPRANRVVRTSQPISRLLLGLKCGGSDGNSGITANPALGAAVDLLVGYGGTAILGETPEIYGAEHLLARRARNSEVGRRILERVRWWEQYTRTLGAEMDSNPSPGNKAGGLTTIYEKSLGAVAKGGTTPVNAVYGFAEEVTDDGLVFMDTPGYDAASITGFIAGGANIVLFTTGRGSVYGSRPAPTIKVASNSDLFRRMADDMDLDAGPILSGVPVEEVARRILAEIIAVASGKNTKSEQQGLGDEEFCPWTLGPML